MPAWLTELPEVAVESEPAPSPTLVEETETKEETEAPSWLDNIVGVAATGVAITTLVNEALTGPEQDIPVQATQSPETAATETTPPDPDEVLETEEDGETPAVEATPTAPAGEIEGDEELNLPPGLADLSTEELRIPSWLSDLPGFASAAATPSPAPVEENQAEAELETPIGQIDLPEDIPVEDPSALPSQTSEASETNLSSEIGWLAGLGAATLAVKAALPAEEAEELTFLSLEEEPELPAWLLDASETAEVVESEISTTSAPERLELELKDLSVSQTGTMETLGQDELISSTIPPAETKLSPAERMSDWLRNLKPTEETLTDEDNEALEATGVLAGLAPLLPVEKIAPATPLLDPQATASTAQANAMLEAARNFFAIATQAPQPATLPKSLTQRDQLMGNVAARAALYLLFIILIALPLLPSLQKVVDPVTDQKLPWTEPTGALSEVLDKQRRELISVQLGAIDLQQPGSVALVSFDYSTATQGEMQPLAEAVIGRLRGQAMRLIFVSLEPEGAALAQRTLDKILLERNEAYGVDMVNLGYVPGQVVGIRELVAGRKQLSALADLKEGLTFADPERTAWSGLNNLGQVDVVITLSDNPATARWWIEQMAGAIPPDDDNERYLLAATSAIADPFLRPYLDSEQLDGLISGINGAAAIEAGRKNFGPARQILDSQGIAHMLIVILIAVGTMVGWMPLAEKKSEAKAESEIETQLFEP
jgi:hypothetical protein